MSRATKVVSLLWIANFAVYVVIATWLGGNALNGYAPDSVKQPPKS